MTMVSIIWFPQARGVTARWNVECFKKADCKVEVTSRPSQVTDLIFTPVPGIKSEGVPLVTQLGGYGTTLSLPDSSKPNPNVEKTFRFSDAVTVLDPNMYMELERWGVEGDSRIVPNASPPIALPDMESEKFTVLCPQGDSSMKEPKRLIEAIKLVGEREPDIEFVFPSKSKRWRNPIDWLELDNLRMLPYQPFENMKRLYGRTDVILPYSSAEILPTTVFEGFISGKPVIVNEIGKVQSVAKEHLEDMCNDFGMKAEEFHDKWKDKYMSGDHFFHCETPEEVADTVMDLYRSDILRRKVGLRGQEWVSEYKKHWTLEDRGKKLLEVGGVDCPEKIDRGKELE